MGARTSEIIQMSFRKRSVVPQSGGSPSNQPAARQTLPQGVRPSPLDGRLTTSTGTHSLDSLLSGHSGLALGTSLFIEENGTTDFSGSLLRYYAAEGVVQGHHVHVLGMNEAWGRDLPGLGAGARDRNAAQPRAASDSSSTAVFCHDFDLSKRLILPSPSTMKFVPLSTRPNLDFKDPDSAVSPFTSFLAHLTSQLSNAPNTTIHRIIVPNILSPAIYPAEAAKPEHLL